MYLIVIANKTNEQTKKYLTQCFNIAAYLINLTFEGARFLYDEQATRWNLKGSDDRV
jgi:hypothetical protein